MTLPTVEDPDGLRHIVDAILAVGSDLSLPVTLRHIVESAVTLVGAKYGALGVLDESGRGLAEFVHVGLQPSQVEQIDHLPEGRGLLGVLIVDPRPLRLADLHTHADSYGFPPGHPPMTSFLGVPIRVRSQVFGNLYLTDKQGAPEFSEHDEALAVALAGAAAIAIENARLHARVRDIALNQDRERIAADLHDTVIQRLYATGLGLEAAIPLAPPELAERLARTVTDLDDTIRQIRSTIFALQAPSATHRGLRSQILNLAGEAAGSLGFEPRLHLDGPIDHAVPDDIAVHLMAVLREALSNVARHAHASNVEVTIRAQSGLQLVASVTDDGVGMASTSRPGGRGMVNITRRAEELGGDVHVCSAAGQPGTTVTWQVPLDVAEHV
jgi:signal transduction histidine kinase